MAKIALLQMQSGVNPDANTAVIVDAARQAGAQGAEILFTPEMAALLDQKRSRASQHIVSEDESPVVSRVSEAAAENSICIALGLPVAREDTGKWANRTLLFDAHGKVAARYDKIHMFDMELDDGESWHESKAYCPGEQAVSVTDTPVGHLGLTICYDLRFPALFEELGRRKCDVIATPAAFTKPTGKVHWHILQRARAIEASAFVIATGQVGKHEDGRETYGHSLVVDPWGDVLLDMGGEETGLGFCDIDLSRVEEVRRQLPSLDNKRDIPKSAPQ
ncbi:carbon-nitrogen hydrolase family protein [Aurantiacibacter sediminis]|uniref:Carbon-nitrogen hydrolase family protein n=1 Tax=Aurantiacibacter sediminis TaxID=2793064 RepID=A0ABS0N4G8_9SPHN|nr:carbon-nitrogen hydrolase family protein [Aurantiacibacter sediminis]MBH5322692.1 carbon-nitrogen hydrolase family protein [Aurantiacibacter sediminis]